MALLAHDKVLRTAIEAHDVFVFSHTGDGVVAAFTSPMSAVEAAVAAQRTPGWRFCTCWRRCVGSPGGSRTLSATAKRVRRF